MLDQAIIVITRARQVAAALVMCALAPSPRVSWYPVLALQTLGGPRYTQRMNSTTQQYVMLSGLPRTGSTLLSAILSQNPSIHAEGNSALCQIMWDTQQSCHVGAKEQLRANGRLERTPRDILSELPRLYYRDVTAPVVLDKCRSWALPANMEMLRSYFPQPARVIVLTRRSADILRSLASLRQRNGWSGHLFADLLRPMSEPLMRSVAGVQYARRAGTGEFIFIDYEELTREPAETIRRLYEFCGWESFTHDFDNVENIHPEDDAVYGLQGMHEIRPKVAAEPKVFELPKVVERECEAIDRAIYGQ
jgi:sulfotransferase